MAESPMTDQATRLLLIKSAVELAGGAVPTIRSMQNILALDGVQVTTTTICRDYYQLGYRSPATTGRKRTGESTVSVKYFRLPTPVYDACCRMSTEQKVTVAQVIRAMVSLGVRHSTKRRARQSRRPQEHRRTA